MSLWAGESVGAVTRFEYERHGVCAMFRLNEPLRGWREIVVGDHRTGIEFATWSSIWWIFITRTPSGLRW